MTLTSAHNEQNAIPLCPSCHRAFDNVNDPGLAFIPTDLQYFIDSEKRDFKNRTDIARRLGHIQPRMTPTPQSYLEHQMNQGKLPRDACGGQYWRYTLRDYFPVNADKSFIPGLGPFKEPGLWHGAPMAALKRAFQILGDPVVKGIPEEQMNALWELRKLYAREVVLPKQIGPNPDDGEAVAVTERLNQRSGAASTDHEVTNTGGGESGPSAPNAVGYEPPHGQIQTAPPTNDAATTWKAVLSSTPPNSTDEPTARVPQQRSKTRPPRSTTHVSLLRFGAGSTTESNVLRYLTMLR
ncbi:hypothetical protein B0A49_12752 [Cryomyces minteri]|uniref:Uncharacterized protein n=1 Tax=Cryomyces minteri TaxID=331657 RepID=A0A4U0WFH0_9PEZI|nr:hypothetical protein B0A49_12752 [Cryomyces minteri]